MEGYMISYLNYKTCKNLYNFFVQTFNYFFVRSPKLGEVMYNAEQNEINNEHNVIDLRSATNLLLEPLVRKMEDNQIYIGNLAFAFY